MILADAPDAATLGQVMQVVFYITGIICTIVIAIVAVATFHRGRRDPKSEVVTKADLDATKVELKSNMDTLKMDLRKDMDDTKTDLRADFESSRATVRTDIETTKATLIKDTSRLESDFKELRNYTRERIHDIANKIHNMDIRIVYIMSLLTQIGAKMGIAVPDHPTFHPPEAPTQTLQP